MPDAIHCNSQLPAARPTRRSAYVCAYARGKARSEFPPRSLVTSRFRTWPQICLGTRNPRIGGDQSDDAKTRVGLTKAAALEYAQRGIRVNAVCPGYVDTPLIEALTNDAATKAVIESRHPQGRLGQPAEIADAVLWLCSDAASFVNGHMLTVDGGYVAQ